MRIPPCGNYGDIDDDGYVTFDDAVAVASHVGGTKTLNSEQMRRSDVDGSGGISLADAVFIGKYVAGREGYDTFAVCETIPGDRDADFPVAGEDAMTVFMPFAVAAVVMYVFAKLLWK